MVYRKFREAKQWGRYNTRMFKRLALRQQEVPMPRFVVPPALQAQNVKIHNPNVPGFFDAPIDANLRAFHPKHFIPKDEDHPHYHVDPAWVFEGVQPFADGVDQACALINAPTPRPIPEHILSTKKCEWPSHLEDLIIDSILAGERYDPSLDPLPKLHDPVMFWTIKEQMYGTPVVKRNNIILTNLYRKVFFIAMQQGLLKDNRCDYDAPMSAVFTHTAQDVPKLIIRHQPHLVIQKPRRVPPLATDVEIKATINEKVPDITPLIPTLDLKQEHIYNKDYIWPRQGAESLNIDTIMFSREQNQKYPYAREQLAADAIMYATGAAALVRRVTMRADMLKQNDDSKPKPPMPHVVKAVQLVDGKLDLAVVQLNTERDDGPRKDGVKNLVWLEQGLPLYKTQLHVKNLEKVEELDIDTFKKFANLLLY